LLGRGGKEEAPSIARPLEPEVEGKRKEEGRSGGRLAREVAKPEKKRGDASCLERGKKVMEKDVEINQRTASSCLSRGRKGRKKRSSPFPGQQKEKRGTSPPGGTLTNL